MIREGVLELDSYRLAQYAVQVPCYICEGGNTFDAELCRHCSAPMALAHQANTQKVRPQMMAVIGPTGVGKTVYLGMLIDMLSRQSSGMQLLARGAFSISLQQSVIGALSRCEFPSKTPSEPDRWNWVHCQVRAPSQRRPVELIMPDMAGEALLTEVDHPRSYPLIRTLLSKCGGVLLLIDAPKLKLGSHDQDYFTMKLLSYLIELDDDPKLGWPQRPLGLVFTKADQCEECLLDPTRYARAHTPGVWQHCQERFARHAFFATGVSGGVAYRLVRGEGRVRVPLRVEPRGIRQPFEWLVDNLRATEHHEGQRPMLIEQAIFTSARTTRGEGYHLVAASDGIRAAEREELGRWGPSHDSVLEASARPAAIGFHRLAQGTPCISRTVSSGDEYSRRGGPRVYTQFLVITVDVFERFANNPFAVLRALQAQGSLRVHETVPDTLEPIRLTGRAAACDQASLGEFLARYGAEPLVTLLDRALTSQALAIAATEQPLSWIAALLNCLPVECRPEFSFTVGLKLSAARATRMACLPDEASERRVWLRNPGAQVFRSCEPRSGQPTTAWARYVDQTLQQGRIGHLSAFLAEPRPGLQTSELEGLARRSLGAAVQTPEAGCGEAELTDRPLFPRLADLQLPAEVESQSGAIASGARPSACEPRPPDRHSLAQHAHNGTRRVTGAPVTIGTSAAQMTSVPEQLAPNFEQIERPRLFTYSAIERDGEGLEPVENALDALSGATFPPFEQASPQDIDRLERLDDLVFEAVGGDARALEELRTLWPQVLDELGTELVAESRDQYLRHSISVWRRSTDGPTVREPDCAIRAMEVLFILYG